MKILVLNAGSSSIKYQLFDMPDTEPLVRGSVEHIHEKGGVASHEEAFDSIQNALLHTGHIQSFSDIKAVGHRVVHGGELYSKPVRITPQVLKTIQELGMLAPLHNPANAAGIQMVSAQAPQVLQVAVFDTAFHQTMPPENYRYALPQKLYDQYKIRRYGFHGSSHHYVALEAAKKLNRSLETLNLITIHLGNGASICAIQKGASIDTSMGFTPLEGLVMGTRSGDIDPAILNFLVQHSDMTLGDVDTMLNKESGLKGLIGSNEMRTLLAQTAQNDPQALMALRLYTNRIKKYLGGYMALLGTVDAVIFTGGVGEHVPVVRAMVLENLENFGIVLDPRANETAPLDGPITTPQSRVSAWVIPTNEELYIARQTYEIAATNAL